MHWRNRLLLAVVLGALSAPIVMAQRGGAEKITFDAPRPKSPPKFEPLPAANLPLKADPGDIATAEEDSEYGPKKFTCTLGGEAFEQDVSWMGYPLEGRPDGGTLGSELTDMMIPECPGNGLVMVPKHDGEADSPEAFAPYTAEEIAKLPALIASADYQAMRKEARYYRLYWIGKKLDRPLLQQLHLLQHISYIAGPPEREKRYLEFFIGEVDALSGHPDFRLETALRYRYFTANALRRLGRFDEAKARFVELEKSVVRVVSERAVKEPANPHFEDEQDYDEDYSLGFIGQSQLKAIEARDSDRHPVSMMSEKLANIVCNDADDDYPPATEATIRACAQRKIDDAEQEKKWQAEFAEQQRLEAYPKELARLCASTAEDKRDETLQQACYSAQRQAATERKEKDAAKLLKNTEALDQQCKAVVVPGRYARSKTALGEACLKRAETIRESETERLTALMEKQPAEYDRLCTMNYPDMFSEDPVEAACSAIARDREYASDEKERERLAGMTEAQILAECESANNPQAAEDGVPMAVRYTPLTSRCDDIENDREEAAWKALEADPVKLEATCSVPYEKQAEALQLRCSFYNDDKRRDAAMEFARDHPKLIAACKATPIPQRDAVLRQACDSYRKCVITRFDEMPYSHLQSQYTTEPPPPAQLVSTCYDTVEQASAAWAAYQNDPKSLRANGCASGFDMWGSKIDAEICAAYARGEDIFAANAAAFPVSYDDCIKAQAAGTQMDCDAIKREEEEVEARNKKREACIKKEMKKRGLEYTGSDKAIGYYNVWEYCEAKMGGKAGAEAMKE